jgi:hypothetical protein
MDFPTNHDIEASGGVHVIIASMLSYFLEFQSYVGRIGRIGNKGRYCVLIHDRDSKKMTGKFISPIRCSISTTRTYYSSRHAHNS